MDSIKIWAHLTGIPLDLRHREGLSLVAGLVGDPKETDAFTLNLVSLTLSHVKVKVDLTKPLPSVVEFQRQSGEVVELLVSYPWLPATCAHCKELGHIAKNCLKLPPPPPPASASKRKDAAKRSAPKMTKEKSAQQFQYVPVKTHKESTDAVVQTSGESTSSDKDSTVLPPPPPSLIASSEPSPMETEKPFTITKSFGHKSHYKKLPPSIPDPPPASSNSFAILDSPQSPPDPPRPSLKRSRSSPTLSPPHHHKTLYLTAPPPYLTEIQIPAATTLSLGVAEKNPSNPHLFPPNLLCPPSSGSPPSSGEPSFASQ